MVSHLIAILWKNFLIRKKHWLLTAGEIVIPIILFAFLAYGRSKIDGLNKVEIPDATYYEPMGEQSLKMNIPVREIHLWYTPYTDFTDAIIRNLQEKFGISGEAIKDFSTESQMLKQFKKNNTISIYALSFKGNNSKKLDYSISIYDKHLIWNTDKLFPSTFTGESSQYTKNIKLSSYISKGFAALQIAVDVAFMEISLGKDDLNLTFFVQKFPYPPHTKDDGFSQLFLDLLPLITSFSFIFLCPAVLQRVGEEKYNGTKEFLKMVGVDSWILWLGWLLHALATNFFSIVVIVVLMKIPFWGVPYSLIENCDSSVLFIFLLLYCTASTVLCFLIATIFRKPSIATIVGVLVWVNSYFIPDTINNYHENLSWRSKIFFAMIPNMALKYGYSAISVFESRDVGISWTTLFQSGSGSDDEVTMGDIYLVLIFDMAIFMLLTIYIENICPGKYGIAKPLSFPLRNIKNWIKTSCKYLQTVGFDQKKYPETGRLNKPRFCIEIKELSKKFSKTVAVENLAMDIPGNSITVFLGHNGAGKTTTLSILTGMIDATRGTIYVNGKDIRQHTNEVRRSIGMCPQHNLLFTDLSVEQHLKFFAMLKGVSDRQTKIMNILKMFNLEKSKNDLTDTLSGGMKRKLCLGMALIGDFDILILDEPTSGMDPESRRVVWDILLEYKKTKTILISTHLIEEADILGDGIAIMANGRLQCYDTPMHLKTKYNTGYHLSILIKELNKEIVSKISYKVTSIIPDSTLLRHNGTNVVYLLPLDKRRHYSALFRELEQKKEELCILIMSLSLTTLEDVFLKANNNIDGKDYLIDSQTDDIVLKAEKKVRFIPGPFKSLLFKRWYFLKKKFSSYIAGTAVSICFIILAMWLNMSNNKYYTNDGPALNLDLSIYGKTKVFYKGSNSSNFDVASMREFYEQIVSNKKGIPIFLEDVSQGIINSGIENIVFYKKHLIAAAEFNHTNNQDAIIVNAMYSSSALHSLPISINLAMNAVVKALLNESFSITSWNTPLKYKFTEYSPSELSFISVGIFWVILIPTAMAFLMSSFIIFPNAEISTNFLKLQTRAGVNICVYWISNIIFDWITILSKLLLLFICIMVTNNLLGDPNIFERPELEALILIFLLYTLSSLPFTYLFSYKKTVSSGFTTFLGCSLLTGIIPAIAVYTLELSEDDKTKALVEYFQWIFSIFSPQFALSCICLKFSQKYVENYNWQYMDSEKQKFVCENTPNPCCYGNTLECYYYKSYFLNEKYGIKYQLYEMLPALLIYFLVLIFLNSEKFEKLFHFFKYFPFSLKNCCEKNETFKSHPDVALTASKLRKTFGRKTIVKNLDLKLERNKCFGLLGVNGAGKSSTINMLAKTLFFDKGKINIKSEDGQEIYSNNSQYSDKIGYCPQENCFNFFLSGRELLSVTALMRRYSVESARKATQQLIECSGLNEYADRPCLEYSGGNKRKLSTCMAFLGSPYIILLDEPTSGVDPASRRQFWNMLSSFKKSERSFVLCSHSMEECENLCDEIAIMKAGQIKRKGTLLSLKQTYQKGYKIQVTLKLDFFHQNQPDETISTKFGDIKLVEKLHHDMTCINLTSANYDGFLTVFYEVDKCERLSYLFELMEIIKKIHNNLVDDYVISDITLEDIFLSIAKEPEINIALPLEVSKEVLL